MVRMRLFCHPWENGIPRKMIGKTMRCAVVVTKQMQMENGGNEGFLVGFCTPFGTLL